MRIRPRLAMAILGFTLPLLMNCALIGTTALMMVHDESPLLIVSTITLSLCVTMVVIKSVFHLLTELAGPLETGPARRITARDLNKNREECIPMVTPAPSRSSSIPSRPSTPVPPPSPPHSPLLHSPRNHVVFLKDHSDLATEV